MSAVAYRNCEKSQKHTSTQKVSRLRYEPGSTRTQFRSATTCTNLLVILRKKELNCKRWFSVCFFLSVETRLLVCKEEHLWKWRAQAILWSEKNVVGEQFRTLHDRPPGNDKVLIFIKLRWTVQIGEWVAGGGGDETAHTELYWHRIGSSGRICDRCWNLGSATRDLFN